MRVYLKKKKKQQNKKELSQITVSLVILALEIITFYFVPIFATVYWILMV